MFFSPIIFTPSKSTINFVTAETASALPTANPTLHPAIEYPLVRESKLKQLEKLETKIEQNLETHKKSLDFFEQNDNCPVCTQKIEEKFRDEKIAKERSKVVINSVYKMIKIYISSEALKKINRK